MSEDFLKNPLSLFDVSGKTAIVTGATGAFGALAAKVLAGAGANVVLCAEQRGRAEEGRGRVRESSAARPRSSPSGRARKRIATRSFRRRSRRSAASTSSWSRPGQNKVSKIVDQKPEDFLDVMDANVTQSWLMARAAGGQMLKQGQGGKVILMSSARGLLGHPAGYTAYCASKSAVDGITKALGCEWGDTGITVNALGPTVFRSPLTAWMFEDTERGKGRAQGLPDARAEGPPRRAVRPRRAAAVPRLQGVGLLHRPHPLRRRRLHGGVNHGESAHRRHRRRPDGPRHRPGVRARRPRRHDLRFGRGQPRQRQGAHSRPTCATSATIRSAVERVRPTADLGDCGARRRLSSSRPCWKTCR